jgi:hypothetical protein
MQIPEEELCGLIDRVVHEGEPELVLAPLAQAPADLPSIWGQVLTAMDPRFAVTQMWKPLEDRLPRVWRALKERLRGVALLRTREVPASLIYFFKGARFWVEYRGGMPLAETHVPPSLLPAEFLDFYRIHDGWVLYESEDYGPLPSAGWRAVSTLWDEVAWKVPRGEITLDTAIVVYRDGDRLALGYDKPASTARPLVCSSDGTVEPLLDMWSAIDRHISELLEGLELASRRVAGEDVALARVEALALHRYKQLLALLPGSSAEAARLGGAAIHEQACDLLLKGVAIGGRRAANPTQIKACYQRALGEWCASVDSGGRPTPREVLDMFGLAHKLGDAATAHFVATIPGFLWLDGSPAAAHVQLLCELYHGVTALSVEHLEQVLGMTFDGGEPPDPQTEIVVRLLESLCRKDRVTYAEWREKADEKLCVGSAEMYARLPWSIRLAGFDAVALRIGIATAASP